MVEFTAEQLRAGAGIIGLQAGTNKCASQSGMSMGGVRHVADIKADDMSKVSYFDGVFIFPARRRLHSERYQLAKY